jgi:acyl-CoA thioester hydrolase
MEDLPYHTPLGPDTLRGLGIPAPWSFGLADRVRFGELDALGHVNHTAYLRWFESFRLPYLKARHVTDYGPTSPRLVLKQVQCTYLAEMGLDLDYIVTGRVSRFRTTSFTMDFAVFLPGNPNTPAPQTAHGETIVVLLNREGPGRYPIPEAGRAAFVTLDGAVPNTA